MLLVNDTNANTQSFLHLLIERSMTPMHLVNDTNAGVTECESHSVNDTNVIWSMTPMQVTECKSHSMVNDTNAFGQ